MTKEFDEATQQIVRTIKANRDARTPTHVANNFYGISAKDPSSSLTSA